MSSPKKPNYELKAEAISKGFCEIQRSYSYTLFRYNQAIAECYKNGVLPSEELIEEYNNLLLIEAICEDEKNKELFDEAAKINKASYSRRCRLSKRIEDMLKSNKCIFLTLTFTDEVLSKTSIETRRRYVTRFLKECSDKYVANIDFGSKNDREHYHAIVIAERVDCSDWNYGAINFERVRKTSSANTLAKYVVKLVNHAIKETTKRNYTIYSR